MGDDEISEPFEDLVDFLNREMSKAWLGQTLTTETPGLGGSFGATRVISPHEKPSSTALSSSGVSSD